MKVTTTRWTRQTGAPRSRAAAVAAAAVLPLVAAACTAATPDPAATTAATTLTAPPAAISWAPCDPGLECAKVPVPLDWMNPSGEKIQLAVIRHKL